MSKFVSLIKMGIDTWIAYFFTFFEIVIVICCQSYILQERPSFEGNRPLVLILLTAVTLSLTL